ncbi:MAG: ABC transporter ATP-binding protein [Puniceicoccaceae bacterium]
MSESEKEIVVSAAGLGKSYRIWKDPSARLKAPLVQGLRKFLGRGSDLVGGKGISAPIGRIFNKTTYYHDFCALKGVDLTLYRGDSIGIIGRNGSGKSTLLQLIAGTLTPSEGNVSTKGRLAALLELGAGFNDEFTGRENVYLNGAILGLSRLEIDERFDRICEFANIGEFIDQPIKTYSSGMRVRLAFAVQAEVDPDILIVDEALAVGDIRFTMKCIRRMRQLIEERNTTLLFVSHDLSSIVNFCKEVIWIHDGEIIRRGDPRTITVEYSNFMHYGEFVRKSSGNGLLKNESEVDEAGSSNAGVAESPPAVSTPSPVITDSMELPDSMNWVDLSEMVHDGNGDAVFLKAALYCPDHPDNNTLFRGGESIEIYLLVEVLKTQESPIICCDIYDMKGNLIYGVNSCFVDGKLEPMLEGNHYVYRFETNLRKLRNGDYVVLFGLSNGTYTEHVHVYGVPEALTFEVKSTDLSQRHHMVSFDGGAISVSAATPLTPA